MTSHYYDHYAPHLSEFDRKFRLLWKQRPPLDWVTALGFVTVGALIAAALVEVL